MKRTCIVVALIVAVPVGVVSATRVNTWVDNLLSFFSLFWVSMPGFWIAIVAVLLLSMHWGLFPISGRGGPLWTTEGLRYLALPGLILGIRQVEVGGREYVISPRLNGLEWARGTVATTRGPLTVEWKRTGDDLSVRIEAPKGTKAKFVKNDTHRGLSVKAG
jgi:hypothetical protein